MKNKKYIVASIAIVFCVGIFFQKISVGSIFLDSREIFMNNNAPVFPESGNNNTGRKLIKSINYLGKEFTLAEFEKEHPPLNEDAPNWAYVLLEGYSLEDALSYSKKILLHNKNPYAIEALPVLMTAFKELNQTGQLEYFLTNAIYALGQENSVDNSQIIYDLAENTLINVSRSGSYSFVEKMTLYKALQSERMPEDVRKAASDFENGLIQECKEYSCQGTS